MYSFIFSYLLLNEKKLGIDFKIKILNQNRLWKFMNSAEQTANDSKGGR